MNIYAFICFLACGLVSIFFAIKIHSSKKIEIVKNYSYFMWVFMWLALFAAFFIL